MTWRKAKETYGGILIGLLTCFLLLRSSIKYTDCQGIVDNFPEIGIFVFGFLLTILSLIIQGDSETIKWLNTRVNLYNRVVQFNKRVVFLSLIMALSAYAFTNSYTLFCERISINEKDEGYTLSVVDNTNKGTEAQYWFDNFLHVQQRKDEYYNTHNVMAMCKNYVTKHLPNEFMITKADQAEILNETIKYFKEQDNFSFDEFSQKVISDPKVVESFNRFKDEYEQERDIQIEDEFAISDSAVKKQSRAFKSVIKLDKNFHIYVHGNNQYIKKGYDETTGMYYYQLFFKEEL